MTLELNLEVQRKACRNLFIEGFFLAVRPGLTVGFLNALGGRITAVRNR